MQPAPAPRFSRTEGTVRYPPPERRTWGRAALVDWGFAPEEIDRLRALGVRALGVGFAAGPVAASLGATS